MSALQKPRLVGKVEPTLPTLDEDGIPGWRAVRRAAVLLLAVLIAAAGSLALAASVVSMRLTVNTTGQVEPLRVSRERARAGGVVAEVLVATGDTVLYGTPLVRLDSIENWNKQEELRAQLRIGELQLQRAILAMPIDAAEARSSLAQVESRVVSARASLRKASVDYNQNVDADSLLRTYKTGAHVEMDNAVAQVLSMEAELSAARARLERVSLASVDIDRQRVESRRLQSQLLVLKEAQERNLIRASEAGVVLTEDLDQLLGAVVNLGEPLVEIGTLQRWRIETFLEEGDVRKVSLGDPVLIEIPALGQERKSSIWGRISSVAPGRLSSLERGVATSSLSGFRAIVTVDDSSITANTDPLLRRGFVAQLSIVTRNERFIVLAREWIWKRTAGRL